MASLNDMLVAAQAELEAHRVKVQRAKAQVLANEQDLKQLLDPQAAAFGVV